MFTIYQMNGGLWVIKLYTRDHKVVKRYAFKTYRECLEVAQLLQLHITEKHKTLRLKRGA